MPDFRGGAWSSDDPISADAWKRAVYRRPPNNFHVTALPPAKLGGSHSYGFRVYPIKDDDASIITRTTSSSGSSAYTAGYDIWRKWEDCLWFQDNLEVEYARAAREKRNRLAAGRGVKKNGVYVHSDQAASWESLPFGPDPNDIARDIHEYIPKLTKKGTLFRASQETIDHRYEDLQKMIQALFQDDLPTLIKEIKATYVFTDFFGVWRRDVDLARKVESSKKQTTDRFRASLPTSILSVFPASPSSSAKGKTTEKARMPFGTLDASSSEDSVERPRSGRPVDRRQEIRSVRSRGSSSESYSSSSSPSTPVIAPRQLPAISRQPIIASQDMSIRFEHNPNILGGERRSSFLESLPEDRELPSSPNSDLDGVYSRKRTESAASKLNRSARVYVPSPPSSLRSSELSSRSLPRYSRASLQSTHSSATLRAATYLDELGVDYCFPSSIPESRCRSRASVSSMASVVTNSSVDAVIPRSEWPARSLANDMQRSVSHSEDVRYHSSSEDEDEGDILDAYFSDLIIPHASAPDGFPQTPIVDEVMYYSSHSQSCSSTTASSYSRYSDHRSSLTTSISSASTSSSGNYMTLSIKATHEANVVMLRLPRHIVFDDLRQKIYDKFTQTDKSPISKSFAIALLEQPPSAGGLTSTRSRADSLSSLGSTHSRGVTLHFISSQDEWDDAVATHNGKMLLRIIGSRE